MPAFDDHRPPDPALLDVCVHCGFCLPTCPTYALWGEEMDSPRGRIVLMRDGLRDDATLTPDAVEHFDRCLGCMACVTACPSGVRYDRLIEAVRPQVVRNHPRTRAERAATTLTFELFTHPGRLRAAKPLLAAARRTGLTRWAAHSRLVRRRAPKLAALARLAPPARMRPSRPLPEVTPARGPRRGRVALLQGCVQRAFFGDVNRATARVLSAEGFEVYAPREPRCCGALMLHAGHEPDALALAERTMDELGGFDLVVANAAGCGSAMKDYAHLFDDQPEWAERARAFSAKVRDVSQVLAGIEPVAERRPVPMTVAYHDACHLAHAQGVREEPRALLRGIPGLELVEPAEWELCCGSAGIYNLTQPEAGDELGARKARNLLDTRADAIASGNPGCTLQIAAHLAEAGRPLPIYHPVELLAMSIRH
ncbi:MAG TPA: (Fe-S)-binding protein [Actinomycetota bacterium]